MLGGSAVHFSLAASFFTDVRVVGPVGDDFCKEELGVLQGRGVITDDIQRVSGGATEQLLMTVALAESAAVNISAASEPN